MPSSQQKELGLYIVKYPWRSFKQHWVLTSLGSNGGQSETSVFPKKPEVLNKSPVSRILIAKVRSHSHIARFIVPILFSKKYKF